jgi:pyridoxal phosphate enzyme (YggS family)
VGDPELQLTIQERLASVRERIERAAAGREVCLVAVSKRQPVEKIRAAYAAGQRHFGENHIQSLEEKRSELGDVCPEARWHFIGRVQRNKAKQIRTAHLVHGVGAVRHANAVAPARVLLQVNVGAEEAKNGFDPDELREALPGLLAVEGLDIRGLMAMPPIGEDPRPHFAAVRALRDELAAANGVELKELSMGMSGDFEAAIEEGATLVRVGTAIFGPRES